MNLSRKTDNHIKRVPLTAAAAAVHAQLLEQYTDVGAQG